MRKSIAVLFLLACLLPTVYGQKTRFSQQPHKPKPPIVYPLKIHISGVQVLTTCNGNGCYGDMAAYAVLNGKKIDLTGNYLDFPTGDYQARLRTMKPVANPTKIGVKYELLLPDGTVWRCIVSGFSE